HLNANVKSILERERPASDPRPPISDYSIVTLGLRWSSVIKNVDLAIYARNLLDEDAREPSESGFSLPFDLPLAGRSFFGEISLRF
ncbi:MAG: TonB-dependent receptor, partial [Acidobacteria bacterium]|nr:TonB-dependent receptor [Acidobacteriota bacterium]